MESSNLGYCSSGMLGKRESKLLPGRRKTFAVTAPSLRRNQLDSAIKRRMQARDKEHDSPWGVELYKSVSICNAIIEGNVSQNLEPVDNLDGNVRVVDVYFLLRKCCSKHIRKPMK